MSTRDVSMENIRGWYEEQPEKWRAQYRRRCAIKPGDSKKMKLRKAAISMYLTIIDQIMAGCHDEEGWKEVDGE